MTFKNRKSPGESQFTEEAVNNMTSVNTRNIFALDENLKKLQLVLFLKLLYARALCLTFAGSISVRIPAVSTGSARSGGKSCVPGACQTLSRTR